MKISKFGKMSSTELEAYQPRSQDECEALVAEKDFREWCKENDEDPENEDSRENYQIVQRESGQGFWEDLDDDEREGWEHNMTRE
jgi:hypothetical protein